MDGSSPGAAIVKVTWSSVCVTSGEVRFQPAGCEACCSPARSHASSTASVVPRSRFRKPTAAGAYRLRSARDRIDLVLPLPALHPRRLAAPARDVRAARPDSGRPLPQADRERIDEASARRPVDEEGVAGRARAPESRARERRQEAGAFRGREGSDARPAGALTAQRLRASGLSRRNGRADGEHRPEPADAPASRASPTGSGTRRSSRRR